MQGRAAALPGAHNARAHAHTIARSSTTTDQDKSTQSSVADQHSGSCSTAVHAHACIHGAGAVPMLSRAWRHACARACQHRASCNDCTPESRAWPCAVLAAAIHACPGHTATRRWRAATGRLGARMAQAVWGRCRPWMAASASSTPTTLCLGQAAPTSRCDAHGAMPLPLGCKRTHTAACTGCAPCARNRPWLVCVTACHHCWHAAAGV